MYYLLFFVFLFALLVSQKEKRICVNLTRGRLVSSTNRDLLFFGILMLVWTLLVFKSESVGNDTFMYRNVYEVAQGYLDEGLIWSWKTQPLYYLIFAVMHSIGLSFKTAQLLIYTFSIATIAYFWEKYAEDKVAALYLWVCMESLWFYMSGLRQMISISFGTLYFDAIIEGKKTKSIVFLVAAILIHKSALILLPLLILLLYSPTRKQLYTIGSVACLLILLIPNTIILKIANMLSFEVYGEFVGQSSNILLILIYVFMAAFLVYITARQPFKTRKEELMTVLFFVCVFLMCASKKFYLISREAYYFKIPLCIAFSNACKKISNKKNTVFLVLIYLCFAGYYFNSLQSNVLNVIPYHFFWSVGEVWK